MNGYWGKVLRVNLSDKKYEIENVSEDIWKKYIGGSGFGAKILLDETPPKVNPYSPENKIIFGGGCWQAIRTPGSAKWSVETKSPLTKTFLDSAGSGDWGILLKKAGYDALILEGRSANPIYLYITENNIEFLDASSLWGKDTKETTEIIKNKLGKKVTILNIGPAGEKGCPIACITCDGHSFAGRGGAGAVMGSKNIKAIAVFGEKQVPVFNLEEANKKAHVAMKFVAKNSKNWRKYGTTISPAIKEPIGDTPMRYWNQDSWPDAKLIAGDIYNETLQSKPKFCPNCPIGCHRQIKVTEPKEYEMEGSGPEYETLCNFGTNLLNSNLKSIAKANDLCNRLGIDTISCGSWIGFLMECWEKKFISEKDTEGIEIKWGDGDVALKLIEKIAYLEGIGSLFKEGIRGAAKSINKEAEDIIVEVKNMDYPAHDPRFQPNLAINYATGTRGACHNRGFSLIVTSSGRGINYPELGFPDPANNMEEAAEVAYVCQNVSAFFGSLTFCQFHVVIGALTLTQICELLNEITGWNWTVDEIYKSARRIFQIQRLVQVRDGIRKKDDSRPKKMTIPATKGGRVGSIPEPFEESLEEYYHLRKWDSNGVPTKESLQEVGLEEYKEMIDDFK